MKFIFFSKSQWDEPPRIRHQLARLLVGAGHEVVFFEKPDFFRLNCSKRDICEVTAIKSGSLIHHQLRLFDWLAKANAAWESFSIRTVAENLVRSEDIIINFNYDYFFIRALFPGNKIVTLINDDFVAQAKFLKGKHVERALKKTCQISDYVLAVSCPIIKQLSPWCSPKLFLPWSDIDYRPVQIEKRERVIFWGHINYRLDVDLIAKAAIDLKDIEFAFIGPVSPGFQEKLDALQASCSNVRHIEPASLDELDLSSCFASIIPYRGGLKDVEAITASNKTFQIMARGIPLITSGIPNFIEEAGVFKSKGAEQFVKNIIFCKENIESIQSKMAGAVERNNASARLDQINEMLGV